jgi:hypothetical protein
MHNISKRGQVTLFIIIGIVIVGAVVLLAVTRKLPFISPAGPEKINIEECIQESINNALDIILPQGGFANPPLYQDYKGKKVAFLCYTNNFYEHCIVQTPFLGENIKQGIETYAESKIKDCFYVLEQDYKDRGYGVESRPLNFSVEILPNKISVNINKELIFIKGEERKVYNEFRVNKVSALFSMLMVVHDAIEKEASQCNFDYLMYMIINPEFSIELKTFGTEVKIYNIKSKKTGEEINFAVRSCAMPPNIV